MTNVQPLRVVVADATTTFGGAFEIALTLVREFNELAGCQALLVSSQDPGVLAERTQGDNPATYLPLHPWDLVEDTGLAKGLRIAANLIRRELPAARRLRAISRAFDASIIHLNNNLNSQIHGVLTSRMTGTPCVCFYRSFTYPSQVAVRLEPWVARHIVTSRPLRDHLIGKIGVPESKISLIYDPVDVQLYHPSLISANLGELFGIPAERRVFSIFGRLVPWKGHRVFLEAASRVIARVPDAHAMIVGDVSDGDAAYGEELRRMATELGIGERVTFTGFRRDIGPLMIASTILVHASVEMEPFGTAILEGMACGRPYVAMNEGGPAEMITDSVEGLLVPPRDPDAMAHALITLLENPEVVARFGRAARSTCVRRFSANMIAKEHVDMYREVTGL